ncbi:MAG: 50S ribosomal protein L35 [Bacillota bacterium]|jgi:large subunit ribosomal protein L35
MPKMKTHRGAAKRFRVTATGKVVHARAGKSHKLTKKSAKRRRTLRHEGEVSPAESRRLKRLIPYM